MSNIDKTKNSIICTFFKKHRDNCQKKKLKELQVVTAFISRRKALSKKKYLCLLYYFIFMNYVYFLCYFITYVFYFIYNDKIGNICEYI